MGDNSAKEESPGDSLIVRYLGRVDYEPVWRAMAEYTNERTKDSPDELWIVEHPPVFTQGQAGKAEHVLMPGDIPVVQVDRGGQVTYHGPGQVVGYPLIDLKRAGIGVRELVTRTENSLISVLADLGIEAYAKPDAPGVYVDEAKIASLGFRIRRGCSYHGLSLNVKMDLSPYQRINPCGYQGLQMTQTSTLSDSTDAACLSTMERRVAKAFSEQMQRTIVEGNYPESIQANGPVTESETISG